MDRLFTPRVDFSEASFKGTKQEFISLVTDTLQRYHGQNLPLDEFHLSLSDDESFRLLEEWIPRLAEIGVKEFYLSIDHFKVSINKQKNRPLPWPEEFQNLKRLDLTRVGLLVPDKLSSCKFPCLDYLVLSHCYGFEDSHLFFDAPKIANFVYEGLFIPSISFATIASSFNSSVALWKLPNDVSLWLPKLSKLLKSLSQSTIYLLIYQETYNINQYHYFEESSLVVQQPVEVQLLRLAADLFSFQCLLNALFRICRPKILGNYSYMDKEVTELLCKIFLRQRESGNEDGLRQFWFQDLEDVRLEIFETNGQIRDGTTLWGYLLPNGKTAEYWEARFRLKWREA